MSSYTLSKEQKEQIIRRVTREGVRATQVAEECGVSPRVVFGILGAHAKRMHPASSDTKLRKENRILKELIANLTIELTKEKKKRGHW